MNKKIEHNKHKPIILTFVAYYLPGYKSGGPVRTIANMVDQLSHELDFRIVTSDRDSFDTKPYQNILTDEWNAIGHAKVFYTTPTKRSLRCMARIINSTPHDVLYLNSFFRPAFTVQPLMLQYFGLIQKSPVVIAPRGEFSKGALELKSRKKKLYIAAVKAIGLYRNVLWQASSEFEAEDIVREMGTSVEKIIIAKDLPALPHDDVHIHKKDRTVEEPLRVCFLSRIDPMKNLDFALRVLAEVAVPVVFDIYGVIDKMTYWQDCQILIKKMPPHVKVNYCGAIDHDLVLYELAKHDLFFFPTRGENFGHVIHEALSAGLPVLISDQTPWRDLESLGIGWDLPLSNQRKFIEIIELNASLFGKAQSELKCAVIQYAKHVAKDTNVLSSNLALFTDILE